MRLAPSRAPRPAAYALFAAVLALLAACGEGERAPGPVTIRLIDAEGGPVAGAIAYAVGAKAGSGSAGPWTAEDGVVNLPAEAEGTSLLVAAPGHLVQRVEDVRGEVEVALPAGLLVTVRVLHEVPLPEPPVHVVLRLRPAGSLAEAATPERPFEAGDLVEWMSCPSPREAALPELTRRGFGFVISQARAAGGVRLPVPGRYRVEWGLFDATAGSWYTLGDRASIEMGVEERRGAREFKLRISAADLEFSLAELKRRIELQRRG